MKYILLVVLFFLVGSVNGQDAIFVPQQYEQTLSSKELISDVKFIAYPYVSSHIDIRDMKRQYPSLVLPDTIKILPPKFEIFTDTTLLMAFLEEPEGEDKLLIWIAGNYERNQVTFYIDETLDRNFRNDRDPIVIQDGRKAVPVRIYPNGKNELFRELGLSVEKRNSPIDAALREFGVKDYRVTTNQFSIGIHGGFGGGKLNYSYHNFETGFPAWYTITLAEKQVGLSFNYNLNRVKFGITSTYQNVFQYTSTFHIRTAEPETFRNPDTGVRIYRENVGFENNLDLHSESRLQLGFLMALRIPVSKIFEIQPTVTAGKLFYMSGEYISNKFTEPITSFKQSSDNFIQGGIRFEFVTGRYKSFMIGMNYNKTWWQPDNFFESFNGDNVESSYSSINALIGFTVGF